MTRSFGMRASLLALLASTGEAFQTPQMKTTPNRESATKLTNPLDVVSTTVASAAAIAASLAISPQVATAVSGGGLDYAGTDISGKDFSNSKQYKGKDFTQVLAKATDFSNSNLQGCRFYKAFLVNTNFEGSDIRGASLEDTSMDGANLNNAIASGAYFSASLIDIASAENADFTDASIPPKTLARFCDREDVKGTNPVTGVDTRDSLMCF